MWWFVFWLIGLIVAIVSIFLGPINAILNRTPNPLGLSLLAFGGAFIAGFCHRRAMNFLRRKISKTAQ